MTAGNALGKVRSGLKSVYYPVAALVISLAIGSIVILLTSTSRPIDAYAAMLRGAFGTRRAWDETFIKAIPFMFTALSFAIARRCGIINLGAEGQFKVGALLATLVAVNFEGLPIALHLPLTLVAGFVGGALYGLIVGALKIRFGASELITTIMLNYVASQIIDFCVNGPMKDSATSSYPQSAQIFESAVLPKMFGSRMHWGLVLVILAIAFYYFFLWKTTKGFEMRVVGLNPSAGAYAGMSIQKSSLLSMLLAGGFAGLGGCVEIIAVQSRLMLTSFTVSYGFTGIAVALMGNNNPVGIFLSGVLFGGLQNGSLKMQTLTDVSSSVVLVVQALIILFIAGRSMFVWRKRVKAVKAVNVKGPSDPTKPIADAGGDAA